MAEIEKIELAESSVPKEAEVVADAPGEGIAEALSKEPSKSASKFRINFDFLKNKKFQKWALIALGVFFFLVVLPFANVLLQARALGKSADFLIEAAKIQDFPEIKRGIEKTKKSLGNLKFSLKLVG